MTETRKRWPWLLVATLLLLLLMAAVVLPFALDVERHRARIERALADATGWEVELGTIELSVLGGLSLTVSPAHLQAPDGSSAFEIGDITIRARALPLLRGRLEVQQIDLLRPEITLVRPDAERGWVLPFPPGETPAEAAAAEAVDSPPAVTIDRIAVIDGALSIEDRSVEPPLSLMIANVEVQLAPTTGTLSGSGVLAGGGRIRWRGTPNGRLELTLDEVRTESIAPWLGPGVLHSGGQLSGDVVADLPHAVSGTLRAESLRVLAGVHPLPTTQLDFTLSPDAAGWNADKLELRVGDARVSGKGTLLPLALVFELPPTPLEIALALSDAAFPLGLDATAPGEAAVRVQIDMPVGGDLTYEARGELSAARFVAADILPAATDLRAKFTLSRRGELKLEISQATVGGGPLEGAVRIDSIDPLGTLTFDGKLTGAALGSLLVGFVPDADRLGGPTSVAGKLAVDLGTGVVELSSIGGTLALGAEQVNLAGWDLEAALRDSIRAKLGKLAELASALEPDTAKALAGDADASDPPRRLLDRLAARVSFDALPWRLEALELQAGGVAAAGAGSFDPVAGAVDLSLQVELDEQATARYLARQSTLRRLVNDRGRLTLPVRIKGPLARPTLEPELGGVTGLPKGEPKEAVKDLIKGFLKKKSSD